MEASLQLIDDQRLVSRYRLHRLQMRAITAITQNYDIQEAQSCNGISALINIFDSQIREIEASSTDITCKLRTSLKDCMLKEYCSKNGCQVYAAIAACISFIWS